ALVFLFATSAVMLSQVPSKPNPVPPSEILGPQLIAWSQMQKPQPVPEPLPPPDRPVQQSEPQTGRSAETAQDPPQQQPAAQTTLSGTIVKDGSRYVLKVSSSSTYELDDQARAKRYEGKQVKVSGTLGASGNSFHIISIELIS
ncbi:MAG: DUF5818 domain-containing protein, partial [Candidatus Sulfotelmatobacter sp.]